MRTKENYKSVAVEDRKTGSFLKSFDNLTKEMYFYVTVHLLNLF